MNISLTNFLDKNCDDMEKDEAIDFMVENYDLCLKEGERLYNIWRENYVDVAGRVAALEPTTERCTSINDVFIKYIKKLRKMQGGI